MSHLQRSLLRYGFALLAVAGAFALTRWLPPLREQTPSLALFAAVVASAWYGGLRPGLFAAVLAALALDAILYSSNSSVVPLFPGFADLLRVSVFTVGVLLVLSLKLRSKRAEEERQRLLGQLRGERADLAEAVRRRGETLALLDTVLRTAPVGLAFLDTRLCFLHINDFLASLNGLPVEQHLGKTVREALPEAAPALEPLLERVLTSGQALVDLEVSGTGGGAPGRPLHCLASYYPVRDRAGQILGVGTVVVDITERKRAEEVLREADRRKDEFLAMLGHELRNPLGPVRNAAHILRRRCAGDPEVEQTAEMMGRQVDHMVRLVDDLLDVSRISRGKIDLRKQPVDLGAAGARAAEGARALLGARQHRLEVTVPAEPVRVEADPDRLEQVVANLLTNAAKYTQPGGHIRLTVAREGGQAVVRVRDNGIGIRPEMLPRVFDLFQQADRIPGRVSEGLGLGLTLVRRLVEMHGGSVEAHSDGPGRGSEFIVRLPLLSAAQNPAAGAAPEASPAAGGPLRILVVDDNVDGAKSLALLLRLEGGHEVRVAHDGPAALELARDFHPDVVFLDIGLPKGMDGYEVARRLRQQPGLGEALLVALTGFGQEEDRRRSLAAGFHAHLVKPVNPDLLREILQPS
jgi:PAS domain S-box-containing protein